MPTPANPSCPSCSKPLEIGDWPWCDGSGEHRPRKSLDPNIHTSERVLVYEDPKTGKITIPPTSDRSTLINQKNERFGLVPRYLETHQQIRSVERTNGVIHEKREYSEGSGTSDRDLTAHLRTGRRR